MNESPTTNPPLIPQPQVISTNAAKSRNPLLYWIIIFLLVLYAIPITFFMIKNLFFDSRKEPLSASPTSLQLPSENSFFNSQIATVNGKITKVSGQKITLVNKNNQSAEFEVAKMLLISDVTNPLATPSGDLKKIQLNKHALISLTMTDGNYKITNINFQPEIKIPLIEPKIPQSQTASGSANTKLPNIPKAPTTGITIPSIAPIPVLPSSTPSKKP